ncbi:MAG: hypothetical protein KJ559_00865 [Nanoarchaeota archaeon]|nr:hypothetical protein [Nanoarchaeota archaeon]
MGSKYLIEEKIGYYDTFFKKHRDKLGREIKDEKTTILKSCLHLCAAGFYAIILNNLDKKLDDYDLS